MNILIYALGGGRGHALRGASLARAFEEMGHTSLVLVPSWNRCIAEQFKVPSIVFARPRAREELAQWVQGAIDATQADLFVVDVFPEGLLDELALVSTSIPRVALLRYRKDRESPRFLRALKQQHYAFDLESHLGWLDPRFGAIPCTPVCRFASEITEAQDLDCDVRLLECRASWQPALHQLGHELQARGLRVQMADQAARPTPLVQANEIAARVVVGPCGYNLGYELAQLGCWHLAIPSPTRYDDQAIRAGAIAQLAKRPVSAHAWIRDTLEQGVARPKFHTMSPAELGGMILKLDGSGA